MALRTVRFNDGFECEVFHDGFDDRILNRRVPSPQVRALFTPWAAAHPVISRSQWGNYPVRQHPSVPILDQDGRGSCTGHGSVSALMLARDIADLTFELLSPCFVYAIACGGNDQGSDVGTVVDIIKTKGTCLMEEFPEPNYDPRQIPASAYQTAQRFTLIDCYSVNSFDEMVTASILGYTVVDTIQVGNNFNDLDSDGCPPVSRGPGNHCICNDDFEVKQGRNGWVIRKRNSWNTTWGLQGLFYMREEHLTAQGQYYEAYAMRAVSRDPQDPDRPPLFLASSAPVSIGVSVNLGAPIGPAKLEETLRGPNVEITELHPEPVPIAEPGPEPLLFMPPQCETTESRRIVIPAGNYRVTPGEGGVLLDPLD